MKHFTIPELPDLRFDWYTRMPIDLWVMLKQHIYQRDQGLCQYCNDQVEYKSSHCHHVLELSAGGTNHPTNLKTVCVPCHKERHPFMKSAKDRLRKNWIFEAR